MARHKRPNTHHHLLVKVLQRYGELERDELLALTALSEVQLSNALFQARAALIDHKIVRTTSYRLEPKHA